MRTLLLASLLSGVTAWSAADAYADPPADDARSVAVEEETAEPDDARPDEDRRLPPRDGDRPRGEPGRRRGFEGERRGPRDRGPDGDRPFGPPGGRFGGRRGNFAPPLLKALDADGDHEISAREITRAADALKTLDTNSDGKLTPDELRPQFAGRGPGDDERGPPRDGERRPPRLDGERRGDGPPEGRDGERHFRRRFAEREGFGFEREGGRRSDRRHGDREHTRPRPPEGRPERDARPEPPCDDEKESEAKPAEGDTKA